MTAFNSVLFAGAQFLRPMPLFNSGSGLILLGKNS